MSIANPQAATCAWSNALGSPANVILGFTLVPNQPATDYRKSVDARLIEIAGFGAVETVGTYSEPEKECLIAVDVAEGQSLLTTVRSEFGDLPGVSHGMLCEKAHVAAEDVMRRLLARTG